MKQEYRELLYKDLSGRLPYNVIMNCTEDDDERTNFNCYLTPDMLNDIRSETAKWNYKPYLRSFEDMSEEEDHEFSLLQTQCCVNEDGFLMAIDAANMVTWLQKHHIDFRGLIDKDLAIRAAEGFYVI